ncbi:MAG TPA: glycosyltransferase [Bacteriovoracaceae bacterium]|nr:glycosyltransferase [Bacteriovoracaceae bacterium]
MVLFTILIISHGHEELLSKCLDSINPGREDWEIIIVANGKVLPESFKRRAKIIDTSALLTPGEARNLGIKESSGKWIFFLGEDTYLGSRYWEYALPLLETPKLDVVGGPALAAKGMGFIPQSLAIALASPFCTGATFSRYQGLGQKLITADEEKLTDLNLWVKKDLFEHSAFPEDFLRGEEILLLQDLKLEGAGIYYHPRLLVYQFHRESARDFFWEGFYRSRLMKRKTGIGPEVFWLPVLFVLLHLTILIAPEIFFSMARLYAGIIVFVSMGLSMRSRKPWLFPFVSFFHYFVVFIYGVGFIAERLKFVQKRLR